MKSVYIVSAVRTPIGSFGGTLSSLSATELGAAAIKGALEKAGVNADAITEVYFGNVCSANLGQAPARQAALGAGIPYDVPCTTVNKVCASGAKSIMLGAQSIMLGHNDVVLAGGMESMSNVPYYVPKARWGYKYGNAELVDGLARDGLLDAYDHVAMGVCADDTAKEYKISREEQDAFAIRSYKLAAETTQNGKFKEEIVPEVYLSAKAIHSQSARTRNTRMSTSIRSRCCVRHLQKTAPSLRPMHPRSTTALQPWSS